MSQDVEALMRQSLAAEVALLGQAEAAEQARRDRRRRAREAAKAAQDELQRELETPLCERPAR